MPDIFLSYNREDQPVVRLFADAFAAEGLDVWWDVALKAGEEYDRVTERALAEARAVIVLWSKRSVESRWVRAEATQAQRNGTLLPVMIEPCVRPVMFELTQTADLCHWQGDMSDRAWRVFLDDVRNHVGKPASSVTPQPTKPAQSERRQISVLSCGLAEREDAEVDPEEWHETLEVFRKVVCTAIKRFDCFVVPSAGESLTAIFGVESAREDDAVRAVRASLAAVAAIKAHNMHIGGHFAARAAVDSGPVVVHDDGASALGPAIDQSLRLQLQADPDSVLVSPATAMLAGGYFELESHGARAFRVAGEQATQTRFDISRARGLSQFIGRSDDFKSLQQALELAAAGHGQVVGVMAEAGTGKSRLCFEFVEQCRANGVEVFEGRAASHGQKVPYLAMLEVVRSFFAIQQQDDAPTARSKVGRRIEALDPTMAPALPLLFDFLSIADPGQAMPQLDPEARQRQLSGLLRHLFKIASEDHPTVVLVEDLHWIDDASLQLLEQIANTREAVRNLLLLNYRPEFRASWMQNSWCRQISLQPLVGAAVRELLLDLLGDNASVQVLVNPIIDVTKGNPFFVEEIVQTLIETQKLEGVRGAYQLVGAFHTLEIPATVKAVVAARIDRLPLREKQVLQGASVIGKDFSEPLLAAVADLSSRELDESLDALRRNEFIQEIALFPVPEYAFKHPLTHEIVLASLLKGQRRESHARVARAIERQDASRINERAAILAHHYEQAGQPLAAAGWHKIAAEWIVSTNFPSSAWHWERVRSLVRDCPDDPAALGLGIAAATQLLNMNFRVGLDLDEARAVLAEGQAYADRLGATPARLMLSIVFSRILCGVGDVAGYLELAKQNEAAARLSSEAALQVISRVLLLDALGHSARFGEALAMAEQGLEDYPRDFPRDQWATGFNPHTFFSFMRGACLTWMGRLEDALTELGRAHDDAVEDGTPEVTGWSAFMMSIASAFAGDATRALASATEVEAISDRLGSPLLAAYTHLAYAWGHLSAGNAEAAHLPAKSALDILGKVERHWEGAAAMLLGEVELARGNFDEAVALAQTAITLCRRSMVGQFEAASHGVLVRARLRKNGSAALPEVAASLERASELLRHTGAGIFTPALEQWRVELAKVKSNTAQ